MRDTTKEFRSRSAAELLRYDPEDQPFQIDAELNCMRRHYQDRMNELSIEVQNDVALVFGFGVVVGVVAVCGLRLLGQ